MTEVAYFRDLFEAVDAVMGTCMEGVGRARRLGWANGAKQSRLVGESDLSFVFWEWGVWESTGRLRGVLTWLCP